MLILSSAGSSKRRKGDGLVGQLLSEVRMAREQTEGEREARRKERTEWEKRREEEQAAKYRRHEERMAMQKEMLAVLKSLAPK
jgi:hypothetical protein